MRVLDAGVHVGECRDGDVRLTEVRDEAEGDLTIGKLLLNCAAQLGLHGCGTSGGVGGVGHWCLSLGGAVSGPVC